MTKALVIAGLIALGLLVGTAGHAAQNLSVEPDGTIRFEASLSGVTRLSIKGDRIRRLVNTASDFEATNDPETGDLFLRYVGVGYFDEPETGFIVSESGVTIDYTLLPVEAPGETVLISLVGVELDADEDAVPGFADSFGYSDDIAEFATSMIRDIAQKHVLGRQVPSGRDGKTVRHVPGDSWSASLQIAVARDNARLVREQDFYRPGVLAIWVHQTQLAAGERSWVIVLEDD
ncbi:MAG: type-F conjugative transfer system secretin TraK [Paracoccaceae bacterium]|nr:type-F conjugative transfer system secretin TraK [Paracoccaceae bacterium]MDG2259948.1 type-F conjugative transfer system secretin TraK [Paracoccaceae bacterium]